MHEEREASSKSRGEVRVWCDGCYDLLHFGHANSLRQAKALGDRLVVGVHTDAEIEKHKRPPVLSQEERVKMVKAIKWVDEVVLGAPYVTTLEILDENNCDFCSHGDDITLTRNGMDTYNLVKTANRYKEVKRTAGISTTDLVKRILWRSEKRDMDYAHQQENTASKSPWTGCNQFLLTTQKIQQFCNENSPKLGDKIVYVAGAFDLFHVGHLDFLERAKQLGNYLIVGLHEDTVVNSYKHNYPIMNLYERVLTILAFKYVDDVVIAAPHCIDGNLLDQFKVDVVCHGQTRIVLADGGKDPYAVAKERGIFKIIDSGNRTTTDEIIKRIISHRSEHEKSNQTKEEKEANSFQLQQRLGRLQRFG